jgi:hypothetical protein
MIFKSILAMFAKFFGIYQSVATGGAAVEAAKIAPIVDAVEVVSAVVVPQSIVAYPA